MLILCVGPDTFRAQEKAHELELAFQKKYDLSGSSIERLPSGKEAIKPLQERMNHASLFASRRLLRTSNLVLDCPVTSRESLARVLRYDPDQTIVISVESEALDSAAARVFADTPKFVRYDFPLMKSAEFLRWLTEKAISLGITDQTQVRQLASFTGNDTWLAFSELIKLAAGGVVENQKTMFSTVFDYADRYLRAGKDRYAMLDDKASDGNALMIFLSQARTALRVRDQDTDGIKPFLISKMSSLRMQKNLEQDFASLLHAIFLQRTGYADEKEAMTLI